jgi:His Kinase A (phospho-acceptor) domain
LKSIPAIPTLTEILAQAHGAGSSSVSRSQQQSEREWQAAIGALETLLFQSLQTMTVESAALCSGSTAKTEGLLLVSPLPVISHPQLLQNFQVWNLTPAESLTRSLDPISLPPSGGCSTSFPGQIHSLPLRHEHPQHAEKFCLVLTRQFSLVLVLGTGPTGQISFNFSFDPNVVELVWQALWPQIHALGSHWSEPVATYRQYFPPVAPSYKTVEQFSHLLLSHLPELPKSHRSSSPALPNVEAGAWKHQGWPLRQPSEAVSVTHDGELLQAIAHEVRTPLATIRTLTRLLLRRRKNLEPFVIKHLETIDRECTEQIDRFNLIFHAVELETAPTVATPMALTVTSIGELLQQSIPRWQAQAQRRNQSLAVTMPSQMPTVVSNPTLLEHALTGLMEQFTRSLPLGQPIQIQITLAGHQLKLQLHAPSDEQIAAQKCKRPIFRAIGQLLMFQPDTGNLSLNLSATKNLFQALGGKLTVRDRSQTGEILTVYLPLIKS